MLKAIYHERPKIYVYIYLNPQKRVCVLKVSEVSEREREALRALEAKEALRLAAKLLQH